MVDGIKAILDFLRMALGFVANIVNGIGQLISMIPAGLAFLGAALAALPPEIAVFGTAMVTISIVFLIVGR